MTNYFTKFGYVEQVFTPYITKFGYVDNQPAVRNTTVNTPVEEEIDYVYEELFTSGTNDLTLKVPEQTIGSNSWSKSHIGGSITRNGVVANGSNSAYYLPFTPVNGTYYSLTCNIDNSGAGGSTTDGSHGLSFGFSDADSPTDYSRINGPQTIYCPGNLILCMSTGNDESGEPVVNSNSTTVMYMYSTDYSTSLKIEWRVNGSFERLIESLDTIGNNISHLFISNKGSESSGMTISNLRLQELDSFTFTALE